MWRLLTGWRGLFKCGLWPGKAQRGGQGGLRKSNHVTTAPCTALTAAARPLSSALPMASLLHEIQHHGVTIDAPLPLDGGQTLPSVTIAYQSYGTLDAAKANAVLVCHALTLDQYVASAHRSEEHTSELQSLMRISYAVF